MPLTRDDARRTVQHRLATHEAALRTAEALGWPDVLAAQVEATRARLGECRDLLETWAREDRDDDAAWVLASRRERP